MKEEKYEGLKICPVCGEHLVEIDDMNYFTSICPKCYSTIFEELDGTLHVIKNGIAKDKYNVSLDIFYKQFLTHQMALSGMLGFVNPGEIIASRAFRVNIYDESIFNHFAPMIEILKQEDHTCILKYMKNILKCLISIQEKHFLGFLIKAR